jgi:tight adherence protein B
MLSSLLLPAILLGATLIGSAWLFVLDRESSRLRSRLVEAGAPAAAVVAAAAAAAARPSIRTHSATPLTRAVRRLMGLPVDNEMVSKLPPRLVVAASAIAGGAALLFGGPRWGWAVCSLGGVLIFLALQRLVFGWERRRWRAALFEQLPDVIGLVCSTVRSGIPLSEAVRSVARELTSPSREQLTRVASELSIGQPLEGALWRAYERTGLAEYAFLAVTMGLHAQTGGSLLEPLENLQELVRRRVAVARRGKALAAEARLSALILEVLPFVAAAGMEFLNPGYLSYYSETPGGQTLLITAAVLYVLGVVSIQQLIRRSLSE